MAMINKQALLSVMALFGDKQKDLANALKIKSSTLSAKINGKLEFRRSEIEFIAIRYKLTAEDIQRIFFALTSNLKETEAS